MTDSNANTSGLDYFGYRVFNAGMGACWLVAKPGLSDTNPEPLVTAASAQARIAELEAEVKKLRTIMKGREELATGLSLDMYALAHDVASDMADRATAAEARADRLAKALERIAYTPSGMSGLSLSDCISEARAALAAAPASPLPGGGECSGISGELKSSDLDALEKLADEATPGEWTALVGSTPYPESDDADSWVAILSPAGKGILTFHERYRMGKDGDRADYDRDAAFIAAANPATIKALIAELKEARAIMADVQRSTQGPSLDSRISAFLARNGKGEG